MTERPATIHNGAVRAVPKRYKPGKGWYWQAVNCGRGGKTIWSGFGTAETVAEALREYGGTWTPREPKPELTADPSAKWAAIPGYEGFYDVSDRGDVRRVDTGRLQRPYMHHSGYPWVSLGRARFQVHRLVLLAFVGPCPPGQQCRHLNGIRHDARLENLAWGTPLENAADKIRHGTQLYGERCHTAKLTNAQVAEIRKFHRDLIRALAAEHGVDVTAITRILNGERWGHLK
jgi:hypothetical protein